MLELPNKLVRVVGIAEKSAHAVHAAKPARTRRRELRAAFSTVAARVISAQAEAATHVPIAADANTPPFAAEPAFEPSHIMLSLLE